MKKIGILGGTFDPPHVGHLIIAEEVRIELNLAEIWFIPSYEPPHKQTSTPAIDRMNMLNEAIKDNRTFKMNPIELKRSDTSYTFDTIKILKEKHSEIEFYFIIGADMVEYLPHWHQIDKLIKEVTFVGVKREGYQLETTYPMTKIDVPMIDISSTFIRDRLLNNRTVHYLIPESVYIYIKERRLYEK